MDKRLKEIDKLEKRLDAVKKNMRKDDLSRLDKANYENIKKITKYFMSVFRNARNEKSDINDNTVTWGITTFVSLLEEWFDIEPVMPDKPKTKRRPMKHRNKSAIYEIWKTMVYKAYKDKESPFTISKEWPDFKTFYKWFTSKYSSNWINLLGLQPHCNFKDPNNTEFGPDNFNLWYRPRSSAVMVYPFKAKDYVPTQVERDVEVLNAYLRFISDNMARRHNIVDKEAYNLVINDSFNTIKKLNILDKKRLASLKAQINSNKL